MTAIVTIKLRCNGTYRGKSCARELPAPEGVRTIAALRSVAYRSHGWSTRGRDLCPQCRAREVGA
ncbi:hypothetical protein [Streptomyces decoyicus]